MVNVKKVCYTYSAAEVIVFGAGVQTRRIRMIFLEIVGAYYGSIVIWSLVTGFMNLLAVKILKSGDFASLRYLNIKILKRQGKLMIRKDKFCFIPQVNVIAIPDFFMDKRIRLMSLGVGNMSGLICYGMLCMLVYYVAAGTEFFRMYMLGSIIFVCFGIFQLISLFCLDVGNSPQALLQRKNGQILALIMEGTHPAQLEEWLLEEVELSGVALWEKYRYVQLQYFCALEKGDEERVAQLIDKMEKALPKNVPSFLGGVCNELIFYYSYLEKNQKKAEKYKDLAPAMIENDMDLNGRRVYAYYLYGKEADDDKILEVIEEGLAVANEFSMPGNIPMETKLLQYLRDLIQE